MKELDFVHGLTHTYIYICQIISHVIVPQAQHRDTRRLISINAGMMKNWNPQQTHLHMVKGNIRNTQFTILPAVK